MNYAVECANCSWIGQDDELIVIDENDCCPDCKSDEVEEIKIDEEGNVIDD